MLQTKKLNYRSELWIIKDDHVTYEILCRCLGADFAYYQAHMILQWRHMSNKGFQITANWTICLTACSD